MRRHDVDPREFGWYGGPWNDPTPPPPPPPVLDERHERGALADRAPRDPALRKRVGLVLGRFCPPHLGHVHVVDTAFTQCGALHIVVPNPPNDALGAAQANLWTAIERSFAEYAAVERIAPPAVPPDPLDDRFVRAWSAIALARSPAPTHLFSSDTRGAAAVAAHAKLAHVIVDPTRAAFPISSTRIRADLRGNFDWLAPGARTVFALHVSIIGCEGSGKTTLAHELASVFDAPIVEDALAIEAKKAGALPSADAFTRAIRSVRDRQATAARACRRGVVISDDSALQSMLWADRLGIELPEGDAHVGWHDFPDLWLVCHPDFPFQGPKERDEPDARAQFQRRLSAAVESNEVHGEVVHVRGEGRDRVDQAVDAIEAALKEKCARFEGLMAQQNVRVP
jgi:NadR type nicotinamide-nucleotide adenylyltransferase